MEKPLKFTYMESPVGELLLAGDEGALHYVSFPEGKNTQEPENLWVRDDAMFGNVKQQLNEYFDGARIDFDLPLYLTGTEFQKQVWKQLLLIPYGETISYGEQAKRIDNPKACQAVGLANGANPISIIVPCHRVIGADKSLTGFGGGLPRKEFLLDLETRIKPPMGHQHNLFAM